MARGPTVIRVAPDGGGKSGIPCCCGCRCCECFNFGFFKTQHGLIKVIEALLGGFCQSLMVKYGMSAAGTMGSAFHELLTTASACQLTTLLLICCYVLSTKSEQLVRQSIFECLFSGVASFLYITGSLYLITASSFFLYPKYSIFGEQSTPEYPIMNAVYYVALILGLLHGIDCYLSYKYYKGYRG